VPNVTPPQNPPPHAPNFKSKVGATKPVTNPRAPEKGITREKRVDPTKKRERTKPPFGKKERGPQTFTPPTPWGQKKNPPRPKKNVWVKKEKNRDGAPKKTPNYPGGTPHFFQG